MISYIILRVCPHIQSSFINSFLVYLFVGHLFVINNKFVLRNSIRGVHGVLAKVLDFELEL